MIERVPSPPPSDYLRERARRAHQKLRWAALNALVPRSRSRLLDYGCGFGDLTWELAKSHDVIGVDVDASRVAFAAREYAPVRFETCRADGLDFPDQSFDVVVSAVVLPFVADEARYLAECRRVLRAGGHLVLMNASGDDLRDTLRRLIGSGGYFHLRRRRVEQLARDAGFEIVGASHYYDAFEDERKNIRDVLLRIAERPLAWMRISRFASYFALLLRRA